MAAKHIEVAKTQGAKEGFKMWKTNLKRSGIPQVQARYDELLSQGDVEAQFRYYCAQYGDKFGLTKPTRSSGGKAATAATPAPSTGDLFAQFQAFLETQAGNEVEDEAEEIDEEDEDAILDALPDPVPATGATTTTRAGKPTTRRAAAPNADPFAPREPSAHATNGRLWKLNELGLLRIAKNPGTAITNGDAHAVLKALL